MAQAEAGDSGPEAFTLRRYCHDDLQKLRDCTREYGLDEGTKREAILAGHSTT